MLSNIAKVSDNVGASVQKSTDVDGQVKLGGVFHFKCFDKDGNLKWGDSTHNLVVNVGLKHLNDTFFSGSSYTATWYLGLVNASPAPSYAAADTLASHAGWVETTDYTGNRKPVTFGAATTADPSVITNSALPSQFSMTGTVTVAGAFLANVDTGTAGILFSVSSFQSPGDRNVVNGDTLSVTYQFSADAA
jgi:hypothetical protein